MRTRRSTREKAKSKEVCLRRFAGKPLHPETKTAYSAASFFLAAGFLAAGFLAAGFFAAGFAAAGFAAAGFFAVTFLAFGAATSATAPSPALQVHPSLQRSS
jgi:hypothetical protein